MARKQLKCLMTGIWIANILILLTAAGVYAWYNGSAAAQAEEVPSGEASLLAPRKTLPPRPSITPVPPPTQRPTITLWPTPSPGPSLTAMAVRPVNMQIIGYTLEKRPLEAYRFGNGPVHKLIVAGIARGV